MRGLRAARRVALGCLAVIAAACGTYSATSDDAPPNGDDAGDAPREAAAPDAVDSTDANADSAPDAATSVDADADVDAGSPCTLADDSVSTSCIDETYAIFVAPGADASG